MQRRRVFIVFWLPVILWMAAIFLVSTDLGAGRRTSRLIDPFFRWLHPEITESTLQQIQFGIRKSAHFLEYAALACLALRACRQKGWKDLIRSDWSWRAAGAAFAIATLYAVSDEIHQTWVPSRFGSVYDVGIDASGAAAGLLVLRFLAWRAPTPSAP